MKKIPFLLSLLALLFASSLYGQKTDPRILTIRKHFAWINNQKDYTVITLEDQDFLDQQPDGAAVAKAYFLDSVLYKVTTGIETSIDEYITDYYYWNDTLFFVYARDLQYGYGDGGIDYNNQTTVYEGRFYYDKGQLIKKIEKGQNSAGFDPDTLLTEAKTLQLYAYVYFWNQDLYKIMQGKWVSEDDTLSISEIKGIVEDTYYNGEYLGSNRLLISNGYLYSFTIGSNDRSKYKIDKITADEMVLLHLPTGNILKYRKVK